jgi:hypothetical protein
MVEADTHLRPLHASIEDIYKMVEPLVCCLKGNYLHHYTITPAKLAPDLGIQVHLRSGNDASNVMVEADIHLRPLHTSILRI